MKKLSLIMALIMTLTSMPLAFAFGASAADNEAIIVETNTEYATLEEAITAVADGQTIKLLKNVDVASGSGIIIAQGTNKNITIEGNNLTITSNIDTANRATFYVQSGSLTLKNLTINVSVSHGEAWGAIISRFEGSVATFENCKINVDGSTGKSAIGANTSGKVILKNTEVKSLFPIFLNYDGSCTFEATSSKAEGPSLGVSGVSGLTFTENKNPFSGGGTTTPPEDDDTPKVDTASIGSTIYYSLPAAFAAAREGDVIKLLTDIDVTTTGKSGRINCYAGGFNLTLDGNGHTITGIADTTLAIHHDASLDSDNGAVLNLVIKNLKLSNKVNIETEGGTALQVNSACCVTLVDTTVTSGPSLYASIVVQSTGTLVVANGARIAPEKGSAILLNGAGAKAYAYGGTIEADHIFYSRDPGVTANICQGANIIIKDNMFSPKCSKSATLNIFGGKIKTESTAAVINLSNISSGANFSINVLGGSFEGGSAIVANRNAPDMTLMYPEGASKVEYSMSTNQGANIRFAKNSSGLRFETTIPASLVELAKKASDAGSEVSYGTVVAPAEFLSETFGILDISLLDNANIEGTKYRKIAAKEGLITNADGSITIRASLVNIKTENYDREFAAAGYISIIIGGERVYVCAPCAKQSVKDSAYKALADVSTTETAEYKYAVSSYYTASGDSYTKTEGTAYSKYDPARIAILNNYVNGVLNFDPNSTSSGEAPLNTATKAIVSNTSTIFRTLGRTYTRSGALACDFTCTGIEFTALCEGEIYVRMKSTAQAYMTVYIDGKRFEERISVTPSSDWVRIAYEVERGEHTIMIVNATQFNLATITMSEVKISGEFKDKPADKELFIEFYGDSILNGSNVYTGGTSAKTSDGTFGFGWIAAQLLGADCNILGHGGMGLVKGDGSYAMLDIYDLSGSIRLSGVPKYDFERIPDAVVIELGINDYVNGGLSGSPDVYAAGVRTFIANLRAKYGKDVQIVWLYGYNRNGVDFWSTTKATLDELIAAGDTNISYYQVSKATRDNPADGDKYHPDVTLAQRFGEEVAECLKKLLKLS